jgi:hypothetical protein
VKTPISTASIPTIIYVAQEKIGYHIIWGFVEVLLDSPRAEERKSKNKNDNKLYGERDID